MGLFNFVKDAGEKLWDAVTGQHDKDDQAKKKILVAVGNISGIASVDDQVKTATPATASQFYTVKSGDTLSAISKQVYGNANLYNKIFEANKPMLKSPDKIYPGQVLRIPEE